MGSLRLAAIGLVPLLVASASVFTLDAREVAVVTSFGAPVRTILEPGLYVRAPWPLHEVVRFDARARVLEVAPTELLTADKKNLVVEAFAIWRVADPQRFLEAVGSPEAAEAQLGDLVTSRVAAAIGKVELQDVLTIDATTGDLLPGAVRTEMRFKAMPGEDQLTLPTPQDVASTIPPYFVPEFTQHGQRLVFAKRKA